MLKSIHIENGFKHHNVTYTFGKGLTTITGPNESGKSLIIEFVRYALFGAKALRGKADDYKKLKVTLEFDVLGTAYRIERSARNAGIYRGEEIIAVGTSPVNAKVPEIFGYGLDVFDAAHAVNQGQIEALGTMKPSERKQMVDSVIGLNVLDVLIKFAGDRKNEFTRDAEAIKSVLVKPEEPVQPENYAGSDKLKTTVELLEKQEAERQQLAGWLAHEPVKPVRPVDCPITQSAEELRDYETNRKASEANRQRLMAERTQLRTTEYTAEQLDEMQHQAQAHDAYVGYKWQIDKLPDLPIYKLDWLEAEMKVADTYEQWQRQDRLWRHASVSCPECNTVFSPGNEAEDPGPEPRPPEVDKSLLDEWWRAAKAWANAPAPVEEVDPPVLTKREIEAERALLPNRERIAELTAAIDGFVSLPDLSQELEQRLAYDAAITTYIKQQGQYDEHMEVRAQKQAWFDSLKQVPAQLAEARQQLSEAQVYERLFASYVGAQTTYLENLEKVTVAETSAEQYSRARTALTNLKVKVKSHLVPSLNKVASILLSQMTNGARQTIQVDEDFNILVDGQELDTLSGSGKAVANLAIRIGLGQVLTNRVFSVFIGDELDAAMDADRAGSTADTLRGLSNRISQLILVTHKRPEADNYIELGEAA